MNLLEKLNLPTMKSKIRYWTAPYNPGRGNSPFLGSSTTPHFTRKDANAHLRTLSRNPPGGGFEWAVVKADPETQKSTTELA